MREGEREEMVVDDGAVGSATSSMGAPATGAGDQKSASMGVCASISANIGAAAIAVKAKIATQTMTTTLARRSHHDLS